MIKVYSTKINCRKAPFKSSHALKKGIIITYCYYILLIGVFRYDYDDDDFGINKRIHAAKNHRSNTQIKMLFFSP